MKKCDAVLLYGLKISKNIQGIVSCTKKAHPRSRKIKQQRVVNSGQLPFIIDYHQGPTMVSHMINQYSSRNAGMIRHAGIPTAWGWKRGRINPT